MDMKTTQVINNKQLFKGNKCNINTSRIGVHVFNSYYLDKVSQYYTIKEDITSLKFTLNVNRGKWVEGLIKSITGRTISIDVHSSMVKLDMPDVKTHWDGNIIINEWGRSVFIFNLDKEGLSFINTWDSICYLKHLRKFHSHVLNTLKKQMEEPNFLSSLTTENDRCDIEGYITKININQIKLNG